jgi:hypothetical protein
MIFELGLRKNRDSRSLVQKIMLNFNVTLQRQWGKHPSFLKRKSLPQGRIAAGYVLPVFAGSIRCRLSIHIHNILLFLPFAE